MHNMCQCILLKHCIWFGEHVLIGRIPCKACLECHMTDDEGYLCTKRNQANEGLTKAFCTWYSESD